VVDGNSDGGSDGGSDGADGGEGGDDHAAVTDNAGDGSVDAEDDDHGGDKELTNPGVDAVNGNSELQLDSEQRPSRGRDAAGASEVVGDGRLRTLTPNNPDQMLVRILNYYIVTLTFVIFLVCPKWRITYISRITYRC